jgi:GMP synthase PP-ATPase subunit
MQVGAPTIAAGYLIWLFSTNVAGDVRELKASVIQHVVATDAMMARFNETRISSDAKIDILIRIMQTQCVNAATDVLQRRNCIEAGR